MNKNPASCLMVLLACAIVPSASAHPGFQNIDGLVSGCAHPLSGWDHLLAMIAVGLWASHLGGRARWALPLTFLGVMTLSASAARAGGNLPLIESGIAASVLVLGLLIATAARVSTSIGIALVAAFAAFHGLAHGSEMPATGSGLIYGLGFLATTALLHAVGLLSSQGLKNASSRLPKFIGWSLTAAGLVLAFT